LTSPTIHTICKKRKKKETPRNTIIGKENKGNIIEFGSIGNKCVMWILQVTPDASTTLRL
jgi:hypothetical protein